MTIIGKSAISFATIGTIGGVGAYAGGLFNSKEEKQDKPTIVTINKKLKNEGFLVLNTGNDENWQEVFDIYSTTSTEKNLFSRPKTEIKSIKELQEECAKILDTDSQTDANYSLARQWCVKKEKMETILGRLNLKLLKFGEDVSEENASWTKKLEELKKDTEKFKAIEEKIKQTETESGGHIKAIKEGCKTLEIGTLETTSDKFAGNLALTREWCSISSS